MKRCELCGTPVKVVGHTTKHYEPTLVPLDYESVFERCYREITEQEKKLM